MNLRKKAAIRYTLPRMTQVNTWTGLLAMLAGVAVVAVGGPPEVADFTVNSVGAVLIATGAHEMVRDTPNGPTEG